MRLMSFALTTPQVEAEIKTVTRRVGWAWLTVGTLLQPVRKAMGFRPGEKVERVGRPIRVVSVRRERLDRMVTDPRYGTREAIAEGFPDLSGADFVAMFCERMKCRPSVMVTRIEFTYVDAPR